MAENRDHLEIEQTHAAAEERPVPVVISNNVDYTNTLRYIAVMLTVIAIIGFFEGIKAWL
jgi:hypothetical protein